MGRFADMNKLPINHIHQFAYDFMNSGNEIIQHKVEPKVKIEKNPIWVYWHQGFEEAPQIVKMCLSSLQKHIPQSAELILLDENNLFDYIDLPQYVIDRVGTNYTHLSDIIRTQLLYSYGGLWIDSTIMVLKDIDENIFDREFWCVNYNEDIESYFNFGKFLNCMASKSGNKLMYDTYNLLCNYWKYNETLCNYFLVDAMFGYLCRENKEYRDIVGLVEVNNTKFYKFDYRKIYGSFRERVLNEYMKDTTFFKTTYKFKHKDDEEKHRHKKRHIDKHPSISYYEHFLKQFCNEEGDLV